jgi:hypothetical protein
VVATLNLRDDTVLKLAHFQAEHGFGDVPGPLSQRMGGASHEEDTQDKNAACDRDSSRRDPAAFERRKTAEPKLLRIVNEKVTVPIIDADSGGGPVSLSLAPRLASFRGPVESFGRAAGRLAPIQPFKEAVFVYKS